MIKKAKSISFLFPYIFSYCLFQPQVMITLCPITNFGRCLPGIITWLPLIKVTSRRCFVLLWEYSKKDLLKNYFRLYICFQKKSASQRDIILLDSTYSIWNFLLHGTYWKKKLDLSGITCKFYLDNYIRILC